MQSEEPKVTFVVTQDLKAEEVDCLGKDQPITFAIFGQRRNAFFIKNRNILVNHTVDYPLRSPCFSNGFVEAVFLAYSRHHHLVLSADDVWIAITTAFSRFVNSHAEEMRDVFVSHQDKLQLEISDVGSIGSIDWNKCITKMSDLIEKNTKSDIRDWIIPNFTTTTPTIRTVGGITLMSSMQHYFSYKFNLCCGLPSVTLRGTLGDWELLRNKIERLNDYNQPILTDWYQVLVPILDQFVSSYCGNVDSDFWNRCCHRIGGGSGPRFLEGWILAFVPFDDENRYILPSFESIVGSNSYGMVNTNDIPTSAAQVPVVIDDNGVELKTIFYAGHLFSTRGPSSDSIQPHIGWTIVEEATNEKK